MDAHEALELKHARSEHKALAALLSGSILYEAADYVMILTTLQGSLIYKVASLTRHPDLIVLLYALCAAALIPNMLSSIFFPFCKRSREFMRASILSLYVLAALSFYLAFMSRNLDLPWITVRYLLSGAGAVAASGVFATILNNQQKRGEA